MRYLSSTIVVCFFIISCSNSGNDADGGGVNNTVACDCNDLVFDQPYNNFYLETPREGYTGLCETFYGNGTLALTKHFKKGKVHGELVTYYENGQIKEQKEFELNFQTGEHLIYDEDGELVFYALYERGVQKKIIFPTAD